MTVGLLVFVHVSGGGYVVCLVFVDLCIIAFVVACDVVLLWRGGNLLLCIGSVRRVCALGQGVGVVRML